MGTNSALFCRCDGPAGKVRKLENYRELAGEAVGEVIAAAKAYGVTFPENYKKTTWPSSTPSPKTPSPPSTGT